MINFNFSKQGFYFKNRANFPEETKGRSEQRETRSVESYKQKYAK
jgi:hypothetical protein